MDAPITLLLIGVTCAVSLIAFRTPSLLMRLILWPPAIDRHRQYDRLVTYGFIHADFWHLLFNMVTLFFFGRVMEQVMTQLSGSRLTFVAFYFSALVVSILPTYLKHQKDPNYRSLGASGAVSAVLFAYILIDPWARIGVFFIPMPAIVFAVLYIAYSIWMDRRGGDNINHGAHLAGAAYGILFLAAMEPRVLGHFLESLSNPSFG
ncbi:MULTISPECIES: rhomboid family intramembrane serine protease [Pseudoxanthomonas]|jgi:membrane associated rhomboid family serine protease|uniref:rhomboid family intramembrane serine protease n=1 Tax=Pseudoxanthomonas TaxID=83618 RepID=UPI001BD1B368|nr:MULTISPECIES: rhomboid family intramembrane serine protease [Pseudoxanthomonas]MCR6627443.1 rhomboid family intramembrane serine protease [Pseudoxanthomonas sp.]